MAKIVRITLLFLLTMTAFYLCNQWVINSFYYAGKRLACSVNPQFAAVGGQDRQVFLDWNPRVNYDVIVAGSSHAYRGYDPRIFQSRGLTMYNIGTGYQNAMASYFLIKNDFQPAPGSLVILDVYDNTYSSDGMGCFSRIIPNSDHERTPRDLVLSAFDLRLLNAYGSFLFIDQNRIEVPLKPGYVFNGFSECTDSSNVPVDSSLVEEVKHHFQAGYLDYIKELNAFLKQRDCKLVLATHPMVVNPRRVQYHTSFMGYLSGLLSSENLIYLDFSEHPDFHPHFDFMDDDHLNQSGVDKYNTLLLDTLERLKLLPPSSEQRSGQL
jgi:hypothetical protein